MTVHVLVADDETLIRQSLRSVLSQEGFAVTVAASGEEAWRLFQSERPDVVLLDLVLGDIDGMEVLRRIKKSSPESKVVVLSAHGTIERAVAAMKLGAYEFIRKPFELEEILAAVRNAARTSRLEGRVEYLAQRERNQAGTLIYKSVVMQGVLREVQLIAQSPVEIVLVAGESGVGKQHIARMVHDQSGRGTGPFIELNCSAIPENLVESELFGHERGAFSDAHERKLGLVEVADGGTLFLDEIGDLGGAAQAKLLTFLEQRTFRRVGATAMRRVDTRIVAATNRDLAKMVKERVFRADLWYRLNGMTVTVPPLRDRVDDVVPLAEHFLQQANREFNRRWKGVGQGAKVVLQGYGWPGNVRELKSVISRAALLHDEPELLPEHLPVELVSAVFSQPGQVAQPSGSAAPLTDGSKIPTLEEIELVHIRRVLELCHGNRTLAAQYLGITRQTLAKKVDASSAPESTSQS
jgi:DNA-binding NtrC family response regulator